MKIVPSLLLLGLSLTPLAMPVANAREDKETTNKVAPAPKDAQRTFTRAIRTIQENDYEGHSKLGSQEFQMAITKANFAMVVEALSPRLKNGYTATYFGDMRQEGYEVYLWKLSFADRNDDILVKLVMRDAKMSGFFLL
jgi:hypothetical protein